MKRAATRAAGVSALIYLLLLAGAGGCGHASFDFLSDEANMESGGAGGSPPVTAAGGILPALSGGGPNFPTGGGFSIDGEGGEGGEPGCDGPGCPNQPCCRDIDLTCDPFDGACAYCSGPDQCPSGLSCDPLTHQCMVACMDHFECPGVAPLCDVARGVCTQCSMNVHCKPGMTCVNGVCFFCEDDCR